MPPAGELFSIAERYGVIGPPGLLKLSSLPAKQLEKLYQETFQAIYDAQVEKVWDIDSSGPPDPFSFHAGASIRGDSGCSAIIELTLNNAMTSGKKRGALIAGCSPAVSLANFGYH